ncbi:MAG: Ig-like domain-containing protein, partial [Acidobacteria bacterium]|nr:Ig-like domain-containing protein [Acidobacteriota bacterium]
MRKAFMAAASTGFTHHVINPGEIILDGAAVVWDPTRTMSNSIQSYNVWADVTDIVRAKLNSAVPGLVNFLVAENATSSIDGEILAVVWDDPLAPTTTITLMYGAQTTTGDAFTVTLGSPVDKTNPATVLDMSLGISYGYQTVGYGAQYSILEMGINGTRISTSAGGQDDGESANGALITVGGIGDTNANPPPYALADTNGFRTDDELYNLLPFVNNGATSFTVNTHNPSNDDNVFFAAIILGNNTAIVGEGILLSPPTGSAAKGTNQSAQALVQTSTGLPIVGRTITFTVISGPNVGVSGTALTNGSGIATFTYSSALAGSDTLKASMINSGGLLQVSNLVTRTWQGTDDGYTKVELPRKDEKQPALSAEDVAA